jgi:1-acyl-sn-glycerol-3-phosphate acyltransferase
MWLRSALFNLCFYVLTATMAVALLPLLAAPRRWMLPPLRLWSRLVAALMRAICGIRLRVTGREHLPRPGEAALIAANHQSAFDTIVWLSLLPDAAYVLKKELLKIPVYGALARKAEMIAVDREAGGAAMRGLIRGGRAAAEAGRQILIFPEGTRVSPGERVPYQPGIAALAAATGLPVVPAATDSGLRWGRRAFRKVPGVITVSILPPLPASLRRDALVERLESAIATETARLVAVAARRCG